MEVQLCWKCRFLVTRLGFLKRKNKSGPCDRCLGEQTVMQDAMELSIWTRQLPPKETPNKPKKNSDTK